MSEVLKHSVVAAPDINAVATRNGRQVDVLLWNYHDADTPAPDAQIHLKIDGLHGKKASFGQVRMDATHSNSYRVWQQMGSPTNPTPAQVSQLEKAGALEWLEPNHPVVINQGQVDIDLTLPRQGVALILLREN